MVEKILRLRDGETYVLYSDYEALAARVKELEQSEQIAQDAATKALNERDRLQEELSDAQTFRREYLEPTDD